MDDWMRNKEEENREQGMAQESGGSCENNQTAGTNFVMSDSRNASEEKETAGMGGAPHENGGKETVNQQNNSDYAFWAYEASNQQRMGENMMNRENEPKYQAADYGYQGGGQNLAGLEKREQQPVDTTYRYTYANGRNEQDAAYYHAENTNGNSGGSGGNGGIGGGNGGSGGGSNGSNGRGPGGFLKKAGILVASAAVFGLVAGGVFQGVNIVAGRFSGNSVQLESTADSANSKVKATTTGSKTELTSDLTELVENTMPSIVSITSTMTEDFKAFGQNYKQDYDASGSGIIIGKTNSDLYIATNNHMVDGATAIAVTFINDRVLEATVKGTDTTSDLAVVTIPIKNIDSDTMKQIKVATLGDSDSVKVGQLAVAIGNSCGVGQSVTVGYISAKDRTINSSNDSLASQLGLLQTDAAINPGNSGGALLNSAGEVIGINDAKYVDSQIEGMGYAIPISDAKPILEELMNREELKDSEKGYLGITGMDVTEDNNYYNMPTGVYIYQVADGGAADQGGLKAGDIITKINGAAATSMNAVQEKVNNIKAGTAITVTVLRSTDGEYKEKELKVTLQDKTSLDKLENSSSQSNKGGSFGYNNGNSNDSDNSKDPNGSEMPQNPSDGGSGEQNDNDLFNNFFNQFYGD